MGPSHLPAQPVRPAVSDPAAVSGPAGEDRAEAPLPGGGRGQPQQPGRDHQGPHAKHHRRAAAESHCLHTGQPQQQDDEEHEDAAAGRQFSRSGQQGEGWETVTGVEETLTGVEETVAGVEEETLTGVEVVKCPVPRLWTYYYYCEHCCINLK